MQNETEVKDNEWKQWHKSEFKKGIITENYFLMDILSKHLPENNRTSCIEIGCSPGTFLIALKKRFGYKMTGLDIQGFDQTISNLRFNNINPNSIKLINANFFEYIPSKRYDIVCSFGLIEHFKNSQYTFKHLNKFIKDHGIMVIGVPRFRGIYWIAHKLMGSGIYHNYSMMKTTVLFNITKGYKILYCGPYKGLPRKKSFLFKIFPPYLIFIGKKL